VERARDGDEGKGVKHSEFHDWGVRGAVVSGRGGGTGRTMASSYQETYKPCLASLRNISRSLVWWFFFDCLRPAKKEKPCSQGSTTAIWSLGILLSFLSFDRQPINLNYLSFVLAEFLP